MLDGEAGTAPIATTSLLVSAYYHQLVRQPVGAFGAGLPRDFLRGQVDRDRDLNGVQRVGSVQHPAEGIYGLQERLRVEPEIFRAHTSRRGSAASRQRACTS